MADYVDSAVGVETLPVDAGEYAYNVVGSGECWYCDVEPGAYECERWLEYRPV